MPVKTFDPSKELRLMLAFFGESKLPLCTEIAASRIPQPYRGLLVHDDHMTVTLETHHESPVRVLPYHVHRNGQLYGRKLDLVADATGQVVMTGMMLLNFDYCGDEVQAQVLREAAPLGRILIESGSLRHISSETFLRLDACDPMVQRFGLEEPREAYGRLATIFCDELPVVDLLEIVNPAS